MMFWCSTSDEEAYVQHFRLTSSAEGAAWVSDSLQLIPEHAYRKQGVQPSYGLNRLVPTRPAPRSTARRPARGWRGAAGGMHHQNDNVADAATRMMKA